MLSILLAGLAGRTGPERGEGRHLETLLMSAAQTCCLPVPDTLGRITGSRYGAAWRAWVAIQQGNRSRSDVE